MKHTTIFRYMPFDGTPFVKEWTWYEHRYYLHTEAWKRNTTIRCYLLNRSRDEFKLLGYQKANGIYVDVWGTSYVIRKHCEGYQLACEKHGIPERQMDDYAAEYFTEIVNKAGNKVEFHNGIVFAKDSINEKWMMVHGANEDYPVLPKDLED